MSDQIIKPPPPETESTSTVLYEVFGKAEILTFLKEMLYRKSPVYLYYNEGNTILTTEILDVNATDKTLILNRGGHVHINDPVNAVPQNIHQFVIVSFIASVKIQFKADKVMLIEHQGKHALKMQIPDKLLRLQRRNYYRINTDEEMIVSISTKISEDLVILSEVSDLSVGGCAILSDNNSMATLGIGFMIKNCEIFLPSGKPIEVNIAIKTIQLTTLQYNSHRIGCMFLGLAGSQAILLQRFVISAERIQRARLMGL